MKRLIIIAVATVVPMVSGYAYLRIMAVDAQGATISQTLSLVRARHQMAKIADAEREEFVTHGECLSFDDLVSMEKLDPGDDERAGYSFDIRCSDELKFDVVGTHEDADPEAKPDSATTFHWPVLVIDQDLKFRKSED